MKRFFYFIILVLIASCKKEDANSNLSSGLLEGFLNSNPKIAIQKTTYSNVSYDEYYSTFRGYAFVPLHNIKISAIGAKIAGYGTFKIEILDWNNMMDTLLTDSIKITNTSIFQFKNINHELMLNANKTYIIRYFNINHNFVYDAGLGYGQSDTINIIKFPLTINDIKILSPYYTYTSYYNGNYYNIGEGLWNSGIFRGLVDFKYELTK